MNDTEELKAGDCAQLKSGGPDMTVSYVDEAGFALCYWFDDNDHLQNHLFRGAVLVRCNAVSP